MEELFGAWNAVSIRVFKGFFSDYDTKHHAKMFIEILSKDEHQQLNVISDHKVKQRFTIRRGMLRTILANACKNSPLDLQIKNNSFGKPYLITGEFNFNTSSSGNIFLFAFSKTTKVGIDIEQINRTFDYDPLIEDYFSVQEQKILKAKKDHQFFFDAWTLKEACAKTLGSGVAQDLKVFDSAYSDFNVKDSHIHVMNVLSNNHETAMLAYQE